MSMPVTTAPRLRELIAANQASRSSRRKIINGIMLSVTGLLTLLRGHETGSSPMHGANGRCTASRGVEDRLSGPMSGIGSSLTHEATRSGREVRQ